MINYSDKDITDKVIEFSGVAVRVAGVVVCTDDIPTTEWSLNNLRPRVVCVSLRLPPDGLKVGDFDLMFNEKAIRSSLVASEALLGKGR